MLAFYFHIAVWTFKTTKTKQKITKQPKIRSILLNAHRVLPSICLAAVDCMHLCVCARCTNISGRVIIRPLGAVRSLRPSSCNEQKMAIVDTNTAVCQEL